MDFVVGARALRLNLHGNSSCTPGQEVVLRFKSIFHSCLFADRFPILFLHDRDSKLNEHIRDGFVERHIED